ncbi:hypothetical protein ACTXIV_13770 [Psychrobacter celer]|uniref:hypothetical protein n=1 Tax=Psychrobacter celer TaxID=306572 RepID=UPI003FD3579F
MTKRNRSSAFNYEPFGESKLDFNRNAFELETLSMARKEVNKIEVQQGFSWESMHLDVPAMVIDIINKAVKRIDKSSHRKKAAACASHLKKTLKQSAHAPTKSKIIANNNVSKWVNDYFHTVIGELVESITLLDSRHIPGDKENLALSEHTFEYKIIQDGNEWLVVVGAKNGARPSCAVTMNGTPVNQQGISGTTQWISALFSADCVNTVHEKVLSFYKEKAHVNNESVSKAKAIADCIGGDYYDYLIIADGFDAARQSIVNMPDDLRNAKADYTATIQAVLDLDRDELNAVTEIFIAKPSMQ